MGRPRLYTDEERREKRRKKTAAWRLANLERYREIVRDSMKRVAAKRAIAEGRIPGKPGPKKRFTEEEQRRKRGIRRDAHYQKYILKVREKARIREQAKRDGTFVSRGRPRLTAEQKRVRDIVMSANRRARVRKAFGRHTVADVERLYELQEGLCEVCREPLGADYHVDHWLPLVRGGSNDRLNLRLLHPTCNVQKGALHPEMLRVQPRLMVW